MDNGPTKGISGTGGWEPINPDSSGRPTTEEVVTGGDTWGTRHWPKLFQYLEEHFAFSAAILAIVGYVVIAAFGEMRSIGQYIGYLVFLGIILFVYSGNKKDKKWMYAFFISLFILLIVGIYYLWPWLLIGYNKINNYFIQGTDTEMIGEPQQ
jgi:hypothetical protein